MAKKKNSDLGVWIEGKDRSTMKVAAIWILFSLGFFSGAIVVAFIQWSDKILTGG